MTPTDTKHRPFVPENVHMKEFTLRAMVIGLVMCVVLGAANAYLGLKAGQTIAATYPAAVIGMAVLRVFKGSILEENIARTAGSIGESVAAGAVFTIPAFVLSRAWPTFEGPGAYWKSTILMLMGSLLGVLFVSLVRRVLVEDRDLPFPESVAASQIHKAGRAGAQAAKYLFYNIGLGSVIYLLSSAQNAFSLFASDQSWVLGIGRNGPKALGLGTAPGAAQIPVGGITTLDGPTISPAYVGVGYVIGYRLAALNFSGSVLAWGLLVPLFMYFQGHQIASFLPAGLSEGAANDAWLKQSAAVWRYVVRPIAVGGMLVGSVYTLWRMRKNLLAGLGRAFSEMRVKHSLEGVSRTEQYMSSRVVLSLIGVIFAAMIVLYSYLSGGILAGSVAAVVMLGVGFCFATVSGYLVGVIGSSNNPISGLTLSTLIIAALLLVSLGVSGTSGVIAVLGVAAVVCVSSAVAGELLQDFKVGYILGGTPRLIQAAELIAVVCASAVMYFPLLVLHLGNIKAGGIGFGDPKLSAPQAGLMAYLAQGIVGGQMTWPLILVGMAMGVALILVQVKSPMLVAIGMYLPFGTVAAIFVGGCIRALTDWFVEKRGLNEAQRARVENVGVLAASGLIAGEALMGLLTSSLILANVNLPVVFKDPSYLLGLAVLGLLAFTLIQVPLANAGRPEDPAPPTAFV
jgi:putative OPT family oligopeptide transporter